MAVLAAIVTSTTTRAQSDAVWQGGAGNWSSANWTTHGPPNQAGPSGDAVDALIDNGNPVNSRSVCTSMSTGGVSPSTVATR